MTIVSLFCEIDDFLIVYEKYKSAHQLPASQCPEKRGRSRTLHPSEVMTILILFHQSRYQTLKDYYEKHVRHYLRWAFPNLVIYNRRILTHKVFAEQASLSKYSVGWFYQINAECAYGIQRVQTSFEYQHIWRTFGY